MTNIAAVSTTGTDPVSGNNSVAVLTVVQPLVCATPGKDGAGGTLTGVVNAYYPPGAGVGTVDCRVDFDSSRSGGGCSRCADFDFERRLAADHPDAGRHDQHVNDD